MLKHYSSNLKDISNSKKSSSVHYRQPKGIYIQSNYSIFICIYITPASWMSCHFDKIHLQIVLKLSFHVMLSVDPKKKCSAAARRCCWSCRWCFLAFLRMYCLWWNRHMWVCPIDVWLNKHFRCKDLESSIGPATIYKWMFQLLGDNIWLSKFSMVNIFWHFSLSLIKYDPALCCDFFCNNKPI